MCCSRDEVSAEARTYRFNKDIFAAAIGAMARLRDVPLITSDVSITNAGLVKIYWSRPRPGAWAHSVEVFFLLPFCKQLRLVWVTLEVVLAQNGGVSGELTLC